MLLLLTLNIFTSRLSIKFLSATLEVSIIKIVIVSPKNSIQESKNY